jgi:hypothetical protein
MDNKLQEEPSSWMDSYPCPDTPPRMTHQDTLGAPTRLKRQTTVIAPTPLTRQDSVAAPSPLARYDTIAAMPPPLTRQDTIGVRQGTPGGLMRYDTSPENQIRELRDQITIINEKLDRILLVIMK